MKLEPNFSSTELKSVLPARLRNRRAFSLTRALVLVAVIAIVAVLVYPSFRDYFPPASEIERENINRASSEARQLDLALENYHSDFQRYPVPTSQASVKEINRAAVSTLVDPTNKFAYLGGKYAGVGKDGIARDPWGNPYRIVPPGTSNNFGLSNRVILVFSTGPGGKCNPKLGPHEGINAGLIWAPGQP
jgi:type II secretory pathway pseudopilin PulG